MEESSWIDQECPRAPAEHEWHELSEDERHRVVLALPAELPWEISPTWSDSERNIVAAVVESLDSFYRSLGQRMFVSSRLAVYYPGEAPVAPEVIVVKDVDPAPRDKWVVAQEGRGIDWVLEVCDEREPERQRLALESFLRLGVREHFLYERRNGRLTGHRLGQGVARVNARIEPIQGRYHSEVLGLQLALENERLRFFIGTASLPDLREQAERAQQLLLQSIAQKEAAERRAERALAELSRESERAHEEAKRADGERRRAEDERVRAEVELQRAMTAEEALAEESQRRQRVETQLQEREQRIEGAQQELRELAQRLHQSEQRMGEVMREKEAQGNAAAQFEQRLSATRRECERLRRHVHQLENTLGEGRASDASSHDEAVAGESDHAPTERAAKGDTRGAAEGKRVGKRAASGSGAPPAAEGATDEERPEAGPLKSLA